MTAFSIRLLAVVAMFFDHLGYRIFLSSPWLRQVGRLAFPLFCFLIAEGFTHTRNRGKYALRLAIMALVSEIPYDVFGHNTIWYPGGQNVYFTLLLGLLAAWWVNGVWESRVSWLPLNTLKQKNTGTALFRALVAFLGVVATGLAAYWLKTDYAFYGVALIVFFSLVQEKPLQRDAGFLALATAYVGYSLRINRAQSWAYTQLYGVLVLIPITLYNGRPGSKVFKWAFYLFYPLHLLGIWLIWRFF